MDKRALSLFIKYFIACVWLVNGLFCKVLNYVPRHEEIVAGILGDEYARPLTIVIGFLEIGMAFWIISGFLPGLNIIVQVLVVATMNVIEFILVPELLLWGKMNALFAFLFIILILTSGLNRNKTSAVR